MGKIFLGILLLVAWLWLVSENFSLPLPDFGYEIVKKENRSDDEAVEINSDILSEVVYVIDGDTFDIANGDRIRLLGIDTPERGECYYQEATDYLRELILGREVRLMVDETNQDKYERLLRHVFVVIGNSEIHVNQRLLKEGHAKLLLIPPDQAYEEVLTKAEEVAKAEQKGRWSECN